MASVECDQMRRIITTMALVLCGPAWCAAQGSELRGLVMDSSGKPVVLSRVTIARSGADAFQTAQTETGGVYRFSNVPSGEYDLTIRASWFHEATIKAVRLGTEHLRLVARL